MPDTSPTPFTEQLTLAAELVRESRWDEAFNVLQPLKNNFPTHPNVLHLWGVVLHEQGDLAGGMTALSQAIAIQPREPAFHLALGLLLKQKKAFAPAMERFAEALELDPAMADAHFHLGDLLMDKGNIDQASRHFAQAVRVRPAFPEAWINLGLCHKAGKALPAALASFQEAIQADPNNARAHVNLAMTHLIMGDYPAGWREYEWRFQLDAACLPVIPATLPRWRGESLRGKTILVIGEQGFGDMLQFIRFVPALKTVGAVRVLLTVPGPLVALLARAPGVDLAQNHIQFVEPIDCYVPLLSIPALLGNGIATIPHATGYLTPDPDLVAGWRTLLSGPGRKVGLIWEGKPLHKNDPLRRRSCTLADLAPLATVPGMTFVSLQKGEANRQPPPPGMPLLSLETHLTDFAATAAAMAGLDLIITIDTSTAHLAGALGKPVWTLLPLAPDWRWGISGDATPWYATMRLFRQTTPDQWAAPVQEMAVALEQGS